MINLTGLTETTQVTIKDSILNFSQGSLITSDSPLKLSFTNITFNIDSISSPLILIETN